MKALDINSISVKERRMSQVQIFYRGRRLQDSNKVSSYDRVEVVFTGGSILLIDVE